ncbi:sir2 family protein [Candidatus Erwinia dacicola]|uniref:Sir2 family protein n=1 Tax=Candidatus Erwinia dacicola TaxID=252393 RepID=A0A328TNR8_9GAMM|nr:sir2 family protein [Candidatus Erwinia dacicola]
MRTPRRRLRLARYKKTRRQVHQRFRQRIFERDRNIEIACHPLLRVVLLTGAGISAESGIQAFRAADGLWEEHKVEDVATPEGFARNLALVELEAALGDHFLLVTQNIDGTVAKIWRW